jgi:hypothetical protein
VTHPVLKIGSWIGKYTSNNINDTKLISCGERNISNIIMLRQDKISLSTHQEEDLRNIISLEVDVLVVEVHSWFEIRADPGNEAIRSVLEELNLSVCLLMNEQRYLNLQALG